MIFAVYWNAVRWRTGFLRIYIVALVVWEAFMVALFVSHGSDDPTAIIVGATIPPIVVYLLVFVAIPWVGKGFK